MGHTPEDILFCVDAYAEVSVEMKLGTQRGKGLCRVDAIKQAIILFIDVIICDGFLSMFSL
jgi:hypothetical protein